LPLLRMRQTVAKSLYILMPPLICCQQAWVVCAKRPGKQQKFKGAHALVSATGKLQLQGVERPIAMKLDVTSPIWNRNDCANPLQGKDGLTTPMCGQIPYIKIAMEEAKNNTPWTNIVDAFRVNTAQEVTEQIISRVENPVKTIDQKYQGFCGTAAHLFILAVAMPSEYTTLVQSVFSLGKWNTYYKGAKVITATENWTTLFKKFLQLNERLICKTCLMQKEISAVDWMSMAALRNSPGDYKWWGSASDKNDQGTGHIHMMDYEQTLFNSSDNLMWDYTNKDNPLPDDKWNAVLQAAKEPHTLLPVAMFSGDVNKSKAFAEEDKRGRSNHIVVLLGIDNWQPLDCLIWTWATIRRMRCTAFSKLVTRVYKLDFQKFVDDNILDQHIVDLDRIKHLKTTWMQNWNWHSLVGVVGLEFT